MSSATAKTVAVVPADGRSREARLMKQTRADLMAHVGGKPSATQRALIETAVQLTVRLAKMDRDFAETGTQSEHASRTYLAWANTLRRTMAQIGMRSAAQRAPTLAEHKAARSAVAA